MEIKLTEEEIREVTGRITKDVSKTNYVTAISIDYNTFDKIKEEIDNIIENNPILNYSDIEIYSEEAYGGYRAYYAYYDLPDIDVSGTIDIALRDALSKKQTEFKQYLELHKKYGEINGN